MMGRKSRFASEPLEHAKFIEGDEEVEVIGKLPRAFAADPRIGELLP